MSDLECFSNLTDELIEKMNSIENAINNGEEVETFYPGEIWYVENEIWYEFVANIHNKKTDHITSLILDVLNDDFPFLANRHAVSSTGEVLDDYFSLWVPVGQMPKEVVDFLFKLDKDLSLRIKDILIECGIPESELQDLSDIYLGCHKTRWPDKPWLNNKILEITERERE